MDYRLALATLPGVALANLDTGFWYNSPPAEAAANITRLQWALLAKGRSQDVLWVADGDDDDDSILVYYTPAEPDFHPNCLA